mgnify:FL=1
MSATIPRILLVGAGGMLGRDLVSALAGHSVTALTRAELDVTDAAAVDHAVTDVDVVINATAWTRVDDAETHEDEAFAVNALAPGLLAEASARHGARLVHVSTDYVFDGSATEPYREDAPRHPVSAYGRTKAEGERRVLAALPQGAAILRTAWLYGEHGSSFPQTMLRLAGERETLTVVDDQRGQPTWSRDLADRLVVLVARGVPAGGFHATSSGETTWFGFAREVFTLAGLDPERVQPTDSAAFQRPAPRPAYSVLGHDAWAGIGLEPMRNWRSAIAAAMAAGILQG